MQLPLEWSWTTTLRLKGKPSQVSPFIQKIGNSSTSLAPSNQNASDGPRVDGVMDMRYVVLRMLLAFKVYC